MKQWTKEEIEKEVAKVPFWWHSIDLGKGVVTPGITPPHIHQFVASAIPESLEGKSVLDVGAWDGYYSFLAEKRGAKRVLAIDNLQHDIHAPFRRVPVGTMGFELAKKILNSKVEYKIMDVYDVDKLGETFDVVFFFGVYYHLEDPMLAFRKLFNVTNELLIVEGHQIQGSLPVMYLYKPGELDGDVTNVWGPTTSCLVRMLERIGFKTIDVLSSETSPRFLCRCYK